MWDCEHVECHNPDDCAICYKEGTTWCPHRGWCRYPNQERPIPIAEKPQSESAHGVTWTPTVAGQVLKFGFVAAAILGTWWLLHSSNIESARESALLAPATAEPVDDFSPWEPES
jgi:hypothetical protein